MQFKRPGFDPWVRKIPLRRKWQPTPIFLPGKSRGQRNLVGYNPWVTKESNMTKWLSRGYLPWLPVTALHSWNRAWSCWQLKAICWWPSPHLVSKAVWVLHWRVYHSLLPVLYFSILKKGLTKTMQSNIYSKHVSHSQEATWYHT